MSEKSDAVAAFKVICPPRDEQNLDSEWLEMCGFFVKGWLAKSAQDNAHLTWCAADGLESEQNDVPESHDYSGNFGPY